MRNQKLIAAAGGALAVLLLAVLPAAGDWDPGMPAKWVQHPDLSPMGIDVNSSESVASGTAMRYVLGDDWECTAPELVTEIHLWGSWLQDRLPLDDPGAVSFTLAIHLDVPADVNPDGYSIPGEMLWMYTFQPGEFTVRPYEQGIAEGWLNPPHMYLPPPADTVCWQYNFHIDEAIAFRQEGSADNPMVYWLTVQAFPADQEAVFGWKTSIDHWNDAAVWGMGNQPWPGPWRMLLYPPGHEMVNGVIDLAFVLNGTGQPQDEYDFGDAPDQDYRTLLASDGARHLISNRFLGALIDGEPDGLPSPNAQGDDLLASDDEDGITFLDPVQPGADVQVQVTASMDGHLDAWIDFNGSGFWSGGEQIFNAAPVSAGTQTLTFHVPGWAKPNSTTFARFRFSEFGGLASHGIYPTGEVPDGEVEDYRVDIGDRFLFKWIQRPDLSPLGIDVEVCEFTQQPGFILADDFLCTFAGELTDIHIWGSWLNDYLPFQEDPYAIDFTLSIHADIPAEQSETGYSMPGELLWLWEVPAGGFVANRFAVDIVEGWLTPPERYTFPADWTCWLYEFKIPWQAAFFQRGSEQEPIVYWLNVKAKSRDPEAAFGWKTSREHWNDDAVWGYGDEPYPGPWFELRYPPQHELEGQSIDLAFALMHEVWSPVDEETPQRTGLLRNSPNPFNPATMIHFTMPEGGGHARIEVFDARGRLVAVVLDEAVDGGKQSVAWNGRDDAGRDLPSGVYFYRLAGRDDGRSMKMLLLR